MNLDKLTVYLTRKLREMEYQLNGITEADKGSGFSWNQFTGRYMLHVLARFTDYVDVSTGNESLFDSYVNRKVKNSYDREHVIPDKYEDYRDMFSSLEEFNTFRWKLGNLILLKQDKNRSYQAMKYAEKRKYYLQNNIIAQSFHEDCYDKNPKFVNFIIAKQYGFKAYPTFGKNEILERQKLYQKMAYDIWSDENLRVISDEWDDAYDQALENKKIESSSVVDIVSDKLNVLTNKKPFMFELDSKKYECNSYVDLVLKTIGLLNEINEEKLIVLAKDNFEGRLVFVDENSKEAIISSMMSGKQTANSNVIVEMHGSGKDLGVFLKSLLAEFGVLTLKTYLK